MRDGVAALSEPCGAAAVHGTDVAEAGAVVLTALIDDVDAAVVGSTPRHLVEGNDDVGCRSAEEENPLLDSVASLEEPVANIMINPACSCKKKKISLHLRCLHVFQKQKKNLFRYKYINIYL